MEIPVLYEDGHVLVLDKPAGLLVHKGHDDAKPELTLVDWLIKKYPAMSVVGDDPDRPGIVHRLDRETSGALIVAKDQKTYLFLKKQFGDRAVQKTYRAIVEGIVSDDRGVIDRPIGKGRTNMRLRVASRQARGMLRDALTYYSVMQRFPGSNATYIEFYPKTGRTHQIRAHAKAINHPVVGDKVYGALGGLPAPRHMLHAYGLTLEIPGGGTKTFTAPLPADFEALLGTLG